MCFQLSYRNFIILIILNVLIISCQKEKETKSAQTDSLANVDSVNIEEGSEKAAYLKEAPSWFSNVPAQNGFIYAVATAKSRQLNIASNKAITLAQTSLAQQLNKRIKEHETSHEQEVKGADTDKETDINLVLENSIVKEQKRIKEGPYWRVFVLLEMPVTPE